MYLYHLSQRKRKLSIFIVYVIAIGMGIISGFSHGTILQSFGLVIADIFIKVFKCISLPIIALSIIVSLAQYNTVQSMQKLWKRTILYTISTTLLAAGIAFILYLIIRPKSIYTITHAESTAAPLTQHSYIGHIAQLIPSNIFSPFLEHQVMGVLLVGIVVGIAIRYISDTDARNTITSFFKGTHGIFLTITGWVVKVIPLGLYGFITSTVTQLHEGKNFESIGGYLCIIVLANLVQGFIILPAWLSLNGILPFKTMKSMMPALSLAFFSKSSVGTLPVTIETAEKNVGINSKISRFVLPLCTTLNMNGCAAFIFTTVIYLMQNHTGNIGLSTMLIWIVVATITAIGNAGVPMGCFFLSASLLVSMDVPITLLGIILPFYSIIDMIETALNVWSDTCVTVVINKKHKIGKL